MPFSRKTTKLRNDGSTSLTPPPPPPTLYKNINRWEGEQGRGVQCSGLVSLLLQRVYPSSIDSSHKRSYFHFYFQPNFQSYFCSFFTHNYTPSFTFILTSIVTPVFPQISIELWLLFTHIFRHRQWMDPHQKCCLLARYGRSVLATRETTIKYEISVYLFCIKKKVQQHFFTLPCCPACPALLSPAATL